ncbi:MAG: Outer rane receptor protein mostly Fe transport [Lacunisphaera sp.]|nr:Outer rane receptor protein mostly Fe transport [Lacunisphaera sp.]
MITSRRPLPLVCTLGLLLSLAASAQPTPTPPKHDAVVELSPFTVTVEKKDGYISSESVTGSRVATSIKDLPFQVNVITSEFMDDFGFYEISSDMAYTSSLTGLDTQGNYSLRGYGATFQLRNGFYRLGLVDRVNIDRIEVIKGPNAAIYGQTSPAGMVNIITKRPTDKASQKLTITGGDYDMVRAEINVNTPLGSLGGVKFSNLISASGMNRTYDTPYANLKQRLFSDAFLATFKNNSSLLLEVESSKRTGVPATSQLPFNYNNATKIYSSVQRPDLATFSQGGPNAAQNREVTTVNLTYENRLSDVWSVRAAAYEFHRHAYNFNTGSVDKYDPTLGQFIRGNVTKDTLNEDVIAMQADLLAHTWFADHKIESQTLLTFDRSANWRYRIVLGPNSKTDPIANVSPAAPNYSLPADSAFNIITRRDHVRWDISGVFLRQQTTFLDGRLLTFAGFRYDNVAYNMNFGDQFNTGGSKPGSLKTAGTTDVFTDHALTHGLGANFKLTPKLTVYANHSSSFYPNAQVAKLGDPRLPSETGRGWDYGIKASYFDNRLDFTLGGFYIDRDGVKTKVTNSGGIDETVAGGSQNAKGVEFDFTWRVTDALTLLGGYGYTSARVTFDGTSTFTVGRRPAGVPVENGGLAIKYSFRDTALKGLSANLGIKYIGVTYPNNTAQNATNITNPPSTVLDAGLAYTWNQAGSLKLKHSVRLSVKNATDKLYYSSSLNVTDRRAFYLAYSLSH